jgi:hypothetical protein
MLAIATDAPLINSFGGDSIETTTHPTIGTEGFIDI